MKKFLKIALSFVIGLATFFVACKKDSDYVASINSLTLEKVEVVNGLLKFNSHEDFGNSIKQMYENQHRLRRYGILLNSFRSQRECFLEFTKKNQEQEIGDLTPYKNCLTVMRINGEEYIEPLVDAVMLSYLVNQEGLIHIGQHIYKFTYDTVYKFHMDKLNDYPKYKEQMHLMPNIESKPILRTTSNSIGSGTTLRWDIAQCDFEVSEGRRVRRKMSGEISKTNSWFYSEMKAQTKHRKKSGLFGWWYYSDATSLEMSGTVGGEVVEGLNRDNYQVAFSDNGANEAEIHYVIQWTALGWFENNYANTYHNVDSWMTCQINQ